MQMQQTKAEDSTAEVSATAGNGMVSGSASASMGNATSSGVVTFHSSAGKNPVKRSVKKAFRFASPSKIEEQLVDEVPEDEPNKKFKKPKGSVFIKKSEAFDFHGEDLNEEDAASFASFAGLDQDEGGHPGNATTASSGSPQQQYVYQSC